MQHDHFLNKFNFDLLTPPPGWGRVRAWGQNICYYVAAFEIPFNLICNMTIFWKSCFLTPGPWGQVCGQNICYQVAAFVILINLTCSMTKFWKGWILNYWPKSQGRERGGGGCGQNISYHFSVFVIPFNLIWNMIMFWKSWIKNFWPHYNGWVCG